MWIVAIMSHSMTNILDFSKNQYYAWLPLLLSLTVFDQFVVSCGAAWEKEIIWSTQKYFNCWRQWNYLIHTWICCQWYREPRGTCWKTSCSPWWWCCSSWWLTAMRRRMPGWETLHRLFNSLMLEFSFTVTLVRFHSFPTILDLGPSSSSSSSCSAENTAVLRRICKNNVL